jgi:hypothetical protein
VIDIDQTASAATGRTYQRTATGHFPRDTSHGTLPTGHFPRDTSHGTLPTKGGARLSGDGGGRRRYRRRPG